MWLITGGCGFIGAHLVHALHEAGQSVVVVDLRGPDCLQLDVCTDAFVHEACRLGPEVIVHLAAVAGLSAVAQDAYKGVATNVLGTLNGLEAARRCGARFIFPSSGAVADGLPASLYGATKVASEALCSAYQHDGLPVTVLRFGNVYGPNASPNSLLATFIAAIREGRPLTVRGAGQHTRAFTYVRDVTQAIMLAGLHDYGYGPFAVGTGEQRSVVDVVTELASVLGRDLPVVHEPFTGLAGPQGMVAGRPFPGIVGYTSLTAGVRFTLAAAGLCA